MRFSKQLQYGLEKPPNDFSDDDDEDDDDSFGMASKEDQQDSVKSMFQTLTNSLNNMYFAKLCLFYFIFCSYLISS